jgi:hypothetical protein
MEVRSPEDLAQEVIFLHVHAGLVQALARDAGADDLRQSVDVERGDAERVLEFLTHRKRPRFGAADRDAQRGRSPLLRGEALGEQHGVARRRADADDGQRFEQLHLATGVAARRGDDARAEALRSAVHAEAPREEPVAPRHLKHLAGQHAAERERARVDLGEDREIVRGIRADRGIAGGARRRVDASQLALGHAEHAERIRVAQIALLRERERREVGERSRCRHIGKAFAIECISVAQAPDERGKAFGLQSFEIGARERLVFGLEERSVHGSSSRKNATATSFDAAVVDQSPTVRSR